MAEGKDAGRISGGAIIDAVNQALTADARHRPPRDRAQHQRPLLRARRLRQDPSNAGGDQRGDRGDCRAGPASSACSAAKMCATSPARRIRCCAPRRSATSRAGAAISIIATKPGWMISAAGTTHGSANPDDQRVPLLFLGAGVKPGRYHAAGDARRSGADARGDCRRVAQGGRALALLKSRKTRKKAKTQRPDPFSFRVLSVVRRIPPGRVATYGESRRWPAGHVRRAPSATSWRAAAGPTCPAIA